MLSSSLKQEYEAKFTELFNQIAFLNQKNAELEMQSIMTFTSMSGACPSCSEHSASSSLSTIVHNANNANTAFDNSTLNGTGSILKQPVALKASASSLVDEKQSISEQQEHIKHLQQRIQQLEYVSRLWDKYMVSLTLLQKQNRDLNNELEEFRAVERKERLYRVFGEEQGEIEDYPSSISSIESDRK